MLHQKASSLALVMFGVVCASGLIGCSGGTTTVVSGDAGPDEGQNQGPIVATPSPTPSATETQACALTNIKFAAGACGTCIETTCCAEWSACDKSKDCNLIFTCIKKCANDKTCIDACATTYPNGADPVVAAYKCSAACNTTCN